MLTPKMELLIKKHVIQNWKLGDNLFNQQTRRKLCKSQNYFYDCYQSISRTKTDAKWTK